MPTLPNDDTSTHYNGMKIQPLEVMEAIMPRIMFEGYLQGNIIKYIMRANRKGQKVSDIEKCRNYCEILLEFLRKGASTE